MFLLNQSTHRMLIQYHPQVGHLYVPSFRARIPNEKGGYFVRTNSLGFRSDQEYVDHKNAKPRILFFGDSYTAGDNCENSERFSEIVGEKLQAEVYNYGLSGSGTDQHLLILREFASEVKADLVVLCVQVDSINRIQVSHRESIDRITGKRVGVPKPFFRLENGKLVLRQVPVPRERPDLDEGMGSPMGEEGPLSVSLMDKVADMYRGNPHLDRIRKIVRAQMPRLQSEVYRVCGMQPYDDYRSASSQGWQLLEAIIRQFISEVASVPVLIVPIPTYQFLRHGASPIYQSLFQQLEDPHQRVSVLDISTPLSKMSWKRRQELAFRFDNHFSKFGHQQVAALMVEKIQSANLLPVSSQGDHPEKLSAVGNSTIVQDLVEKAPLYILGLSCFYHNSAACLIKDGKIVAAAEEERFTRVKSDRGFPHQAANYCLEEGGIHQGQLSAVVYYDNPYLTFERLLHTQLAIEEGGEEHWMRFMPSWLNYKLHIPQLIRSSLHYESLVLQESHHRSHCASAFFPSPFSSAAILTVDGVGEWATATIGKGSGHKIEILKEMQFPHSLGLLYSAFTQFTGFKVNSGEYKMMGLAPYGEPTYVNVILDNLLELKEDGSIELNLKYFGFLSKPSMTNERFAELFDGPPRAQDGRITRREMDIARSIQIITEMAILKMATYAKELTGEKYLCLSGGVALNCVANGRLLREGPFEDIWIQPAAGDSGSALGAALDAYHTHFGQGRKMSMQGDSLQGGSYWGPSFSDQEIRAFLNTHGYPYQEVGSQGRNDVLTHYLQEGKVIGHFAGRMEFGPRALGARSIIGDPRNSEMQVNLNVKIKYRESFRPFAPSVLAERVQDYFELDRPSPYMLLVAPVKKERQIPFEGALGEDMLEIVRRKRSDLPSITHVDYSARIQTVRSQDNPIYYDLIKRFEELTGCGVIVNTSFNVRGEPIICTPYDAYRCFMRTEMDVLALGNFILLKEKQPAWPEKKGHIESPDEVEDVETATPLTRGLQRIYQKDFLPFSKQWGAKGIQRIQVEFKKRPSTWEDCKEPKDPFGIPSALDSQAKDPEAFVEALTSFWKPGLQTEAVKPLLTKLLRLGLRYPPKKELAEDVSDAVYVVF